MSILELILGLYIHAVMYATVFWQDAPLLLRPARRSVMVPFDRPHDLLLLLRCNNVSMLHHFRDIVTYFPKFKEVAWPEHILFRYNVPRMY